MFIMVSIDLFTKNKLVNYMFHYDIGFKRYSK